VSPRIDLHTHSHFSDGALSPEALVALAQTRLVEILALTDHDTVAGCERAAAACADAGIRFVPGAELSCDWRGREVHVIGLDLDTQAPGLLQHCAAMAERRRERMRAIGQRLSAAGLPGDVLIRAALAATAPTRTHVAQALCDAGIAADHEAAFEKWLASGRPAHVTAQWDPLESVVQRIRASGGTPVLAHPHRYRCSNGQLRSMVDTFKQSGGLGIEVSLAGMGPGDTDRVASLARRFELAGSFASDFHRPDVPWRPLGRFDKLPDGITPVTVHLGCTLSTQ
jgi:predicted metal-dependent phosphoesterase TrpH